jgi:hypothetical protein
MIKIFTRKKQKVRVSEPATGFNEEYIAYKVRKAEPNHVKLVTDKGKVVEIKTNNPMDIIVEDL